MVEIHFRADYEELTGETVEAAKARLLGRLQPRDDEPQVVAKVVETPEAETPAVETSTADVHTK